MPFGRQTYLIEIGQCEILCNTLNMFATFTNFLHGNFIRQKHHNSELIQGGTKNWHNLYALILSNINRFTKLFHFQNQKKICNNTVTKNPTTSQVCRYTIL